MDDRQLQQETESASIRSENDATESWTNFEILEELGSGGMGTIYRAVQKNIDRPCAIKVLSKQNDEISLKRFLNEAKLICSLDHPNIVKVLSVGYNENLQPFFTMELLHGFSLDKKIGSGKPLNIVEFRNIFSQVLDAMIYAHGKGIIHRDLKPSNIFLLNSEDDETPVVKLLDFGIAKNILEQDKLGTKLTRTGVILGTPAYISPEQSLCQKLDQSSDIYSLGVVMYEALTGRALFEGDTALDIMYKHANEAVDSSTLPKEPRYAQLNSCILRSLNKSPSDRFASVEELKAAMAKAWAGLEEEISPRSSFISKKVIVISIVSLLVLSLLGTLAVMVQTPKMKQAADIAKSGHAFELLSRARALVSKASGLKDINDFASAEIEEARAIELYQLSSKGSHEESKKLMAEIQKLLDEKEKTNHNKPRIKALETLANREPENEHAAELELGFLFDDKEEYSLAYQHFLQAAKIMHSNRTYNIRAIIWAAESLFKKGEVYQAIGELKSFINLPIEAENQSKNDHEYGDKVLARCKAEVALANIYYQINNLNASRRFLELAKHDQAASSKKLQSQHPLAQAAILIGLARTATDLAEANTLYKQAFVVLSNLAENGEHNWYPALLNPDHVSQAPEQTTLRNECLACAEFFDYTDDVIKAKRMRDAAEQFSPWRYRKRKYYPAPAASFSDEYLRDLFAKAKSASSEKPGDKFDYHQGDKEKKDKGADDKYDYNQVKRPEAANAAADLLSSDNLAVKKGEPRELLDSARTALSRANNFKKMADNVRSAQEKDKALMFFIASVNASRRKFEQFDRNFWELKLSDKASEMQIEAARKARDNELNNEFHAQRELAEMLSKDGRLHEASQCYFNAMKAARHTHEYTCLAGRHLAKVLYKLGKKSEAFEVLQSLLDLPPYPDHPEQKNCQELYWERCLCQLAMAQLLYNENRLEESRALFQKARDSYVAKRNAYSEKKAKLTPTAGVEIYIGLGQTSDDSDLATKCFQQAVELIPDNDDVEGISVLVKTNRTFSEEQVDQLNQDRLICADFFQKSNPALAERLRKKSQQFVTTIK